MKQSEILFYVISRYDFVPERQASDELVSVTLEECRNRWNRPILDSIDNDIDLKKQCNRFFLYLPLQVQNQLLLQ